MLSHKEAEEKLKKSRGVRKLSTRDFVGINIIPTYANNALGSSSLNDLWSKQFTRSLRWEDFCWVIERLLNTQILEVIHFSGGEPVLWNEIEKAIYYSRKRKIKTHITTNGILHTQKSLPDKIFLNLHTYIDFPTLRKKIEESIDFYKGKTRLHLRLYLRKNEKAESLESVQKLAQKFALALEVYPTYLDENLNCDNCIYSRITMQPDGDTITLCNFLPISTQLKNHLSLHEAYEKDLFSNLQKQSKCLAQLLHK